MFWKVKLSSHPDTSSCPSEEYAQERTGADWPVNVCKSFILYAAEDKSHLHKDQNTQQAGLFSV